MSNNPNDEVSDTEWKMIHWIDSKVCKNMSIYDINAQIPINADVLFC